MLLSSATLLAAALTAAPARADGWTDHIKLSGDFRYRNEWSTGMPQDLYGKDMRWRQRVRARLSLKGIIVDDQLVAGLRIRTGSASDANSPHQTMGTAFGSYAIGLDRAYLQYNPGGGATSIWAGKFAHPFTDSPVYRDFIWDEDVNPDGVAADLAIIHGDDASVTWHLLPAAYLLQEISDTGDQLGFDTNDAYLFAAQSDLHFAVGDGELWLANAWYQAAGLDNGGISALLAENAGNALTYDDTTGEATGYVSDFQVLDNLLGADLALGEQKLALGARFAMNFGADADNIAWQVGAALPLSAGKVGLKPFVDIHARGAEAMFSNVVDDDHQVGTGMMGGVAGVNIKPVKAVGIKPWVIFEKADGTGDRPENLRFRVDVNGKF